MDEGRCAACGDALGVYEPLVVVIDGQDAGRTSFAALGPLPNDEIELMHESCFAGRADRPRGPGASPTE